MGASPKISVNIPYTSVNKSDAYYSWFLAARALGKSIYKIMHACIQDDDPPALRRAKGSGSEGRRGPREKPRTPTLPGRGRRCPRRIRPPEPRGPCELVRLGDDGSRQGPVLRYVPRIRCRPDGCAKPGPPPVRTAVDVGVRLHRLELPRGAVQRPRPRPPRRHQMPRGPKGGGSGRIPPRLQRLRLRRDRDGPRRTGEAP